MTDQIAQELNEQRARALHHYGDQAKLAKAQARIAQLEDALRDLVAKIDELTPAINGQTFFCNVHGVKWTAGNWATELDASRAALAQGGDSGKE